MAHPSICPKTQAKSLGEIWKMLFGNTELHDYLLLMSLTLPYLFQNKDIDLTKDINYFNNPKTFRRETEYDLFFSYTRMFPLWDQRKNRDNRRYPPDIHEHIFQQVLAFNSSKRNPL